jgi:photosystem II stability/assembly factor-like uncharacterized protein
MDVLAVTPPFGYVITDSALLRSRDNGSSWDRLGLPEPTALIIDREAQCSILAAFRGSEFSLGRSGLFESRDDGMSWTEILSAPVVAVAASGPSTLYAGTYQDGVWRSEDGGSHWAVANTGLVDLSAISTEASVLAVDASEPSVVYASTTSLFPGPPFPGPLTAGVFKSSDSGRSWTKISDPPAPILSLAILADSNGLLFAGTTQGLFRSRDGGRTWAGDSQDLTDLHIWALVSDPSSRTLYAATDNGVFRLERSPTRAPVRTLPLR